MLSDTLLNLEAAVLTETQELEELFGEWFALWAETPGATPFQSPKWLLPWWRHFGQQENNLRTITLRDGNRLVGVVPLFLANDEAGSSEIRLLGTGVTDYLDALCQPGFETSCLEAAFVALDECDDWETADFEELRPDAVLSRAALPGGWMEERAVQSTCPVVRIPGRDATLQGLAAPGTTDWIDYYWRRASSLGAVSIEAADPGNFDPLFDAFVRLHQSRWRATGRDGVAGPHSAFYREVAQGFLQSGELRLYGWRVAGQVIASLFGFEHQRRFHYYLGGFDPDYRRLSPGHVLIGHALGEAIRDGALEFDFLRGDDAYKYRWGAEDRLNHRRQIRRPSSRGAGRPGLS